MAENTPDLTLAERQVADVIARADRKLAAAVSRALEEATEIAAAEMQAIGQEDAEPTMQYFAAIVHQRMYCLMCGADPDTFEGGDPEIAYHVIRNSQNIARHYWSADIEPSPAK
jgi:hypothetical protein